MGWKKEIDETTSEELPVVTAVASAALIPVHDGGAKQIEAAKLIAPTVARRPVFHTATVSSSGGLEINSDQSITFATLGNMVWINALLTGTFTAPVGLAAGASRYLDFYVDTSEGELSPALNHVNGSMILQYLDTVTVIAPGGAFVVEDSLIRTRFQNALPTTGTWVGYLSLFGNIAAP